MLNRFKDFVEKEVLFQHGDKILLAVSGGMDSVVLSHLFNQSGLVFGIAHCNFNLRGKDSVEDEIFVRQLAAGFEAPFYGVSFETTSYAHKHKQSIQMAARDLRYNWLEKIRKEKSYVAIATAHHLNDSIETVLYNFTKGCGIRGMHGILPKNGNIIRPLLFAERSEIEDYSKSNAVYYREDASNDSDKYMRNKIRHHVIPVLQAINPSFEKTVQENIKRLRDTERLFLKAIEGFQKSLVSEKEGLVLIDFKKLPQSGKETILFELIREWGFNSDQVKQILEDHEPYSGRQFFSDNHRLVIGRDYYIISSKILYQPGDLEINTTTKQLTVLNKTFTFSIIDRIPSSFSSNLNEAFLDLDLLVFPLKLRRWEKGDRFQPLGMNGQTQSLQDFFTHQKLSIPEKEKVWILESDGKICWIVGMRIDERFKVSDNTKKCLNIKLKTH